MESGSHCLRWWAIAHAWMCGIEAEVFDIVVSGPQSLCLEPEAEISGEVVVAQQEVAAGLVQPRHELCLRAGVVIQRHAFQQCAHEHRMELVRVQIRMIAGEVFAHAADPAFRGITQYHQRGWGVDGVLQVVVRLPPTRGQYGFHPRAGVLGYVQVHVGAPGRQPAFSQLMALHEW